MRGRRRIHNPDAAVATGPSARYPAPMLRLGTFRVDCTPPVGCGVDFGLGDRTTGMRDPLYMRGFVLEDGSSRCLLASMDWCGLTGAAHEAMRDALAEAAGAPRERTMVHCIHQHDAPLLAFEIEPLLGRETFPRPWWEGLVVSCAGAARECAGRLSPVGEVGHAETRLHGYASNRRILGADGRVRGMRFSRTRDRSLVEEPVGTIDPALRTLAFRGPAGRLEASMSFYATHPQVSNGRKLWSADAPGEAMRLLSECAPGAAHAFFTGPGGNVTAGKYTSPDDLEGNLLRFGGILADGIERNLAAMEWEKAGGIQWSAVSFPFPFREGLAERLGAELADPSVPEARKRAAAAVSASIAYPPNSTYVMNRLVLGSASVLFLSGEPFVEYQLMAQAMIPDRFLATVWNCPDNHLYLPLAAHFAEGGYETESFCLCDGRFEPRFREAARTLLLAVPRHGSALDATLPAP